MVVALFVTTEVPVETINEVLKAGVREDFGISVFCLVRSPTQENYDRFTFGPVEAFSTGFTSVSIEELGAFRESIGQQKNGLLEPDSFAVIDERSLRDRTVNFVCKTAWRRDEEEDDEDSEDEDEDDEEAEWQSVRIAFDDVATAISTLSEYEDLAFGPKSVKLVDKDGVWHQPRKNPSN